VTARRAAGWIGVVGALALAAFLAVLAADVLRWRGHLEAAALDVGGRPGDTKVWIAETRLPGDPAATLLGVDDDVALRRALQLFRLGNPRRPARNQNDLNIRLAADARLADVGDSESSPAIRSRAALLRGVLSLEAARGEPLRAATLLRRSLADMRTAIRLDDRHTDAKYDLELVLRLLRTVEEEPPQGGQGQQRRGGQQGQGAGQSRAGSGF
jgi:hypothetical protein